MVWEPLDITLKFKFASSVPSDASIILLSIFAYVVFSAASLSAENVTWPIKSWSATAVLSLWRSIVGPAVASESVEVIVKRLPKIVAPESVVSNLSTALW